MGQIVRCPLTGISCGIPITVEGKSFFLAEAEKPPDDRKWRREALSTVLEKEYKYEIRSALDESDVNAFTCKICEMIQTCAYGIVDITGSNNNVLLELGMMIALGKPTIILVKSGQEQELKLPSDIIDKEVIPFRDYTEIMPKLRQMVENLPPPVSPPSPIQDLEKIQPQLAKELRKVRTDIVEEFKKSVEEAKLDTILLGEEKKDLSSELDDRLRNLEGKLEDMVGLGFTTDAKTAFLRGNYYYNQGKYNEALAIYNWSLELKPGHISTLNSRGIAYAELERYDEALVDFNHALKLNPDNPDILNNRGLTYNNLNRYDDALADHNRSLELRPDHPATLTNRGITYDDLERYDDALADYNLSLELRPDHPATLNNRGLTYDKLERYEEALADCNHALEVKPDDPDVLNNRGTTYSYLQRYDDAFADYSRALELKPDDAGILYNLACLFSLWGKTNDALAYLEKAIDKDKKYREMAKTDKDFDNIRDDPRFKKLIESD